MQAWHVRYRRPDGEYDSWVVMAQDDDLTPGLVGDIRDTILLAHSYDTIQIVSIQHVDRAIVARKSRWLVKDHMERDIG